MGQRKAGRQWRTQEDWSRYRQGELGGGECVVQEHQENKSGNQEETRKTLHKQLNIGMTYRPEKGENELNESRLQPTELRSIILHRKEEKLAGGEESVKELKEERGVKKYEDVAEAVEVVAVSVEGEEWVFRLWLGVTLALWGLCGAAAYSRYLGLTLPSIPSILSLYYLLNLPVCFGFSGTQMTSTDLWK